MNLKWFVIVNPTSGNGISKKLWPKIKQELIAQQFNFEVAFTEHEEHSTELVQNAINNNFLKIISVGGDGSLHNIINGIFNSNITNYKSIKLGVIPIGTGNDWVKSYQIPINYKKAIEIIKEEYIYQQDIGKLSLTTLKKDFYFNNLAGIGFDGHVVNKVHKYKYLGFLAYIIGALVSLIGFKRKNLHIEFNETTISGKSLMLLIGIGKYSGGGMQLTENVKTNDGLFDISYVKKVSFFTVIKHISKIFNGKATQLPIFNTYKTSVIKVSIKNNENIYIQADGELIETDNFTASIIPRALQFIVPKL
ncbi:lipid kinase, YegS/Rv2252/BmrU family [Lutibacter oricola]|uniref:Lipid kinase, YegS/Rv2252/BmrU family n=1 Tax=Lutibacter oricola TaxID=762486 RepID=A0A1H2QPT6_9FLAO|nr:diacylglycerol kinase family protein [Lutibacter oricola]SDW09162.1 lipid kinase, YegS/Rv2252/BmrU family [Lutibacter oricola]